MQYENFFAGDFSVRQQCDFHTANENNEEYLKLREEFLEEIVSDPELLWSYKMINWSFSARLSQASAPTKWAKTKDIFVIYLSHRNPNQRVHFHNYRVSFQEMTKRLRELCQEATFKPGQMLCVREYKDYEMYFDMSASPFQGSYRRCPVVTSDLELKILNSFNLPCANFYARDFKALSSLRSPVMVMDVIPLFFGGNSREYIHYRAWVPQINSTVLIRQSALKTINSRNWRHKNMKDKAHVRRYVSQSRLFKKLL
jgi:hypothetical protein